MSLKLLLIYSCHQFTLALFLLHYSFCCFSTSSLVVNETFENNMKRTEKLAEYIWMYNGRVALNEQIMKTGKQNKSVHLD